MQEATKRCDEAKIRGTELCMCEYLYGANSVLGEAVLLFIAESMTTKAWTKQRLYFSVHP